MTQTPRRAPLLAKALAAASGLALAGCASLPSIPGFGGGDGDDPSIDEIGRIAMVLGEERLQPDPELAAVTLTLPVANTLESWEQAGAGPSKVVGHVAAARDLTIAWRREAGAGSNRSAALTMAPVASREMIYVLDSRQTIRAFDLQGGAERWRLRVESGNTRDTISIGGGLGLSGDTLVMASGFGKVLALDAATGSVRWQRDMDAPMTGAPTIREGQVYVSSNNNELFALSLETGETDWSDQAISEPARVLGSPSVAAVEDIVVAPYSSGEVIAYLASNGRRLWSDALSRTGRFTPISSINDIAARPVLAAGLVFAANQSGVLAAIEGRTGTRIWAQPIGSTQAPALVGEYLFIMGVDGTLAALNAGTGGVYWARELERYRRPEKQRGRISYAGPLVASGRVLVVSSEGDLIAHDPQTGAEVSRLRLGDAVYLEPIAVGDTVYVLTDTARLIAIR